MPAVRVDRLAASHQLYVLLLACFDDWVVSMFFTPWLAAVLHQAHQGLRVSPGVQDAFRISPVVEMMKLKNTTTSNNGSSPAKKPRSSDVGASVLTY